MANDVALTTDELEEELQSLPGWEFRGGWLRQKYKTPGWPNTMLLANAIACVAEAAWHHPDFSLGYAQVIVTLQTHRVQGVTHSDISLAHKVHEIAVWQPVEDSPLNRFLKNWVQ